MGVAETGPLSQLSLPPGFRFFPSDEELLVQYLCRKVAGHHFTLPIIAEIDLYKFDPWVLPSKAIFGEKEWYFFSPRDRKYPNGSRPNRVAGTGYWKATGTDKVITTEGRRVGIKKALVFYIGKAPKGTKTNWIMHEYRLFEPSKKTGSTKLDDWVLCRIYKKNSGSDATKTIGLTGKEQKYSNDGSSSSSSSHLDEVLESLPSIDERYLHMPRVNSLKALAYDAGGEDKLAGLLKLGSGNFDWATLAGLAPGPEPSPAQQSFTGFGNGDVYVPSVPAFRHVEEEVQSGLRTQQRLVDQQRNSNNNNNSVFFQPNSGGLNQGFATSSDQYGFRYPGHRSGYGYGR